jgi:hypothetical protein
MCGFSVWQATGKPASDFHKLQTLRDKLRGALPTSLLIEDLSRAKLKELLTTLFNQLEQPIELDELVRLIAEVCGLKDKVAQNNRESTSVDSLELLPDARADIEKEFERRVYLQKLWAEICQLPEKQRAALLLNLKDAQGGCGIAFFPLTGIANFRQLAQALALSAEELAEVWHHLPLDDLTIAARLAVTRQQVINLRKSARERLARRLNDY